MTCRRTQFGASRFAILWGSCVNWQEVTFTHHENQFAKGELSLASTMWQE